MGKVIGILSLKGGVGKTSAVLSLGSAIADLGKKSFANRRKFLGTEFRSKFEYN